MLVLLCANRKSIKSANGTRRERISQMLYTPPEPQAPDIGFTTRRFEEQPLSRCYDVLTHVVENP